MTKSFSTTVEMSVNHWNLYRLINNVLKDRVTCIEWLMEQGLLPKSRNCPKCKKSMKVDIVKSRQGMGRFRCQRRHASGNPIELQISKGTWFEEIKINSMKAVLMIYAFTTVKRNKTRPLDGRVTCQKA